MQRCLIALLLLCLHVMARGQTQDAPFYYWFDSNHESLYSGNLSNGQWKQSVDVSHLRVGLHTIYLMATDSEGRLSSPVLRQFYKIDQSSDGEQFRCLCYVDGQWFSEKLVSAQGGMLDLELDASSLSEGMHRIQLQVMTEAGVVSGIYNGFFMRVANKQELGKITCLCYVDGELFYQEKMSAVGGVVALNLDAENLTEGLHRIQLQVITETGILSGIYNGFFLRVATQHELGQFTCLCYVDGEIFCKEELSAEGGLLHLNIDANSLTEGLHRIQLQVFTESGVVSGVYNGFFLRVATTEEISNYSCMYSIDDETESHKAGLPGTDGTYHFDIDLSTISDGLHHISYFLSNDKGGCSSPQSRFFIKMPEGGNSIANYQYWLNDDFEGRKDIRLPKPQNPFKLISLLPIDAVPLRSQQFHFEVKDGQPMMYAKNDFHARFFDASGRFTDASDQYIDYNVGQEVTDVEWLESGVPATTDKPEENTVKWYQLEAEFGDSLIFKSNRACTMQLYAPSGEEIYTVSGSESVKQKGCHVFSNGTYYLALHNVAGTSAQNVTLNYQKIDRYAILAYTPKTMGAPSLANISIDGNGFNDSTKVCLALNDNIVGALKTYATDLGHLTASFMLDSIPFGAYDLRVKFTDTDSITISRAVKIEKADSITDVSIALEGNGSVMRGRTASYRLHFTNHSNLPVLSLPFTLTIDCGGNIENLTGIKFETDFKKQARESIREAFADVCTPAELEDLISSVVGDDDLSMFYADTLSYPGKAYLVGNFVLPRLDGNSTLTIPFSIWCDEISNIVMYAFTDPHWNIYNYVIKPPYKEDPDNPASGGSEGYNGSNSGSDTAGGSADGSSGSSSGGSGGDNGSNSGSDTAGGSAGGSSGGSSGGNGGGTGSGGSGGSGHGGGSGSSGSWDCKDVCAPRLAYDCLSSVVESVNVFGSIGEAVRECAGDYIQDKGFGMIFDYLCEGKVPDFSRIQREPAPILTDIAADITVSGLKCVGVDVVKRIVGGRIYKVFNVGYNCLYKPLRAWVDACSYTSSSLPVAVVNSCEPNEIYGYTAESGSKAVKDGVTDVYYTIQFENDTVFATAPAHDIYLTDTLDVTLFDLSSYKPTRIKIGSKNAELTGEPNFITTVDMRPEIHAIAQVEGTLDEHTGIASWHISSLDPMTMEPIEDATIGVLPVNYDGSGIGEASFGIALRPDLPHGTEIPNRSGNVFDNNETVMTPTWINVIDRIAPVSVISDVAILNDSTAAVSIDATDELSGPWRYDVFVQYGQGAAWWKAAENICVDTTAMVKIYPGIDHGLYVVATDSAGNVERKLAEREFTLNLGSLKGDVNGDETVNVADIAAIVNVMAGKAYYSMADVNNDGNVNVADIAAVVNVMAARSRTTKKINEQLKQQKHQRK